MSDRIRQLRAEAGQAIVEYALLIAAVALLLVPAVLYMSYQMDQLFSKTAAQIEAEPLPLPPSPVP